jgi:hypothetical protein
MRATSDFSLACRFTRVSLGGPAKCAWPAAPRCWARRVGSIVWTDVTNSETKSTISQWSVAAAIFGAACNVLCLIFEIFQSYYLARIPLVWIYSFIAVECISLAPLLVLFIWRRLAPVVLLYTLALFSILMGRVYHLVQYYKFGAVALAYKIDSPGLLLTFLGGISIIVVLVWAAIRWVAFIRNAPKSDGAVP